MHFMSPTCFQSSRAPLEDENKIEWVSDISIEKKRALSESSSVCEHSRTNYIQLAFHRMI